MGGGKENKAWGKNELKINKGKNKPGENNSKLEGEKNKLGKNMIKIRLGKKIKIKREKN